MKTDACWVLNSIMTIFDHVLTRIVTRVEIQEAGAQCNYHGNDQLIMFKVMPQLRNKVYTG